MKIQELFNVTGKVTIVTGGASGIGYAYAEVMAAFLRDLLPTQGLRQGHPTQPNSIKLQDAEHPLHRIGDVGHVLVAVMDPPASNWNGQRQDSA